MKNICILFLALAASVTCPLSAMSQSQGQMNQQANLDFRAADARLNRVYQRVIGKLDKQSQAKLRKSQRAWLLFRDAEADLRADVTSRGGSMAPLVYAETKMQLTKARILDMDAITKDQQ